MNIQKHHLQTIESLSRNWLFHIEFKLTMSDNIERAPISSLLKVFSDQGEMLTIAAFGQDYAGFIVSDGYQNHEKQNLFTTVRDVYNKLTIAQLYSYVDQKYVVEARVDGELRERFIFDEEPKAFTNVEVYAGNPLPSITALATNIKFRNYYFIDVEE